jgi:hypothetical protein
LESIIISNLLWKERERVNSKYVQVLDVDGFEQGPFGVEE